MASTMFTVQLVKLRPPSPAPPFTLLCVLGVGGDLKRKMSRKLSKKIESKLDRMEHYKSIVLELLPKKDDSSPKGVIKEVQSAKTQTKAKEGYVCHEAFQLFAEQINGLPKNDNDRLKHVLHEITAFLKDVVDEVNQDIQSMEESGETRQETPKFSAGLLGELSKMVQLVDDMLNIAASKSRPMTRDEKIELGKRIRKLPGEALNRAVEIITARKPTSQSSDRISLNLGKLDDATLWRLYYHVEHVLKKNKT